MTDTIASLQAIIGADVSGLQAGLNKSKGLLGDMSASMRQTGAQLTAGLTVPIIGFLTASVKAASDNQTALTQLQAVIKSTGGAAGVTAAHAEDYADALSKTTRFSKDAVLSTEDLLLTFTSIGKDIFPDVTKATLDMSQALGQDTKSSAIQLGKALQDPVKGVTALKRVGVEFTDAQIKQIKTLVQSGKTMDAQRLILKEIQKEFGGSAQAAGQTFAGQMDILNHSFTDFQEKVGYIIIPVLEKFMTGISNIVDGLNRLNPNILQIGIVAAVAIAAIGPILGILGSIGAVIGFILSPIGLLVVAIGALAVAWQTDFGGIREKVMPILNEFVNFIKTQVLPGLQKFADWFIKDVLPAVGKSVKDFGDNILNPVIRILGDVWKVVGPELQKLGDWFLKNVWPQISLQLTIFNIAILQPLIHQLATIWDSIAPGLKQFADWFDKNIPAITDAINKLIDRFQFLISLMSGHQVTVNGVTGTVGGSVTQPKPSQSTGNVYGDILSGFTSHAAGGYVASPQLSSLAENGPEYVVPQGGALVSKGGGSGVIHIELNADGFTQHIYARVAAGMAAGS